MKQRSVETIMNESQRRIQIVQTRSTPEERLTAYLGNDYWNWFEREYEGATYADDTDIPWEPPWESIKTL